MMVEGIYCIKFLLHPREWIPFPALSLPLGCWLSGGGLPSDQHQEWCVQVELNIPVFNMPCHMGMPYFFSAAKQKQTSCSLQAAW